MYRRTFALLLGTIALAGCDGAPQPLSRAGAQSQFRPAGPPSGSGSIAADPQRPRGLTVALLAPLTGANAERGQAMLRAAQLALATHGAPPLDARDTFGTPQGAEAAATAAIAAGAGIIIGPLTTGETAAVAGPAQAARVPVLAFTSDPAQARPGVWTLGITPAQQVTRMVAAAAAQGKGRFAAVLPETEFGRALAAALTAATGSANLPPPDIRFHNGSVALINATMRELSGYAARRGPVDAQIRAARAQRDAEGRRRAAELGRTAIPAAPFDALLLADTGELLGTIASLLPFYDIDPPAVRVLGPALWAAPGTRADAPLLGAWFAAPDPAARAGFVAQYQALHGAAPPGLADFAFDAAAIARVLAAEGAYAPASLTRPEGFAGVNGVLALRPDGTVRRGLAVFEIRRGAPDIVEPAPDSLDTPGT